MPLAAPVHRGRALDRSEAELHAPVRRRVLRDHARRAAAATERVYDVEVPLRDPDDRRDRACRLWVDGELRARVGRSRGTASSTRSRRSTPRRGSGGFMRWADATLPDDDAERAITLRRVCDIGMGRGMDLDARPGRDAAPAR